MRWIPALDNILRARWASGFLVKVISHELGCSASAVRRQRVKLDLPARPSRWRGGRGRAVTVRLPDEEYEMVARGAARGRATHAQYLRMLIRRDASNDRAGSVQ